MDERETTAVIDRALAGDPPATGYPRERELQELTLALAAEAPEPDADFATELDERVQLGFPRDGRTARLTLARARIVATARRTAAGLAPRLSRRGAPLAGGIASAAVAVVAVLALSGGDASHERDDLPAGGSLARTAPAGDAGGGRRLAAPPAAVERRRVTDGARESFLDSDAVGAVRADAPVQLPSPLRRPGFAPGVRERRIERSATLTLAAPAERLDRVAAAIASVTERHRGFVLRSSLSTGGGGATTGGDFELRIPAARLQPALADLAELGQVRARTQSGEDVTAAFVTAGDRLEAARAERRGLLARLEAAASDNEAESLRLRLDANAGEINRLRGRIRNLRAQTDYASVSVTLEPRDGDGGSTAPGDGLGGALDDAVSTLGGSLELAIRVLGVAIPLGLVAGAAALSARAIRRRRREAALAD